MRDVANDATAFAHRDRGIMVNVASIYEGDGGPERDVGAGDTPGRDPRRRGRLRELPRSTRPGPGPGRLPRARRGTACARSRPRYDPTNLFHRNQNIPPAVDSTPDPRLERGARVRPRWGVPAERTPAWLLGTALAVPLLGLALVLGVPEFDVHWEHHPSHFWLVLGDRGDRRRARPGGQRGRPPAPRRAPVPGLDGAPRGRGVPRAARPRHAGRGARRTQRRVRAGDAGRPVDRLGLRGLVRDRPRAARGGDPAMGAVDPTRSPARDRGVGGAVAARGAADGPGVRHRTHAGAPRARPRSASRRTRSPRGGTSAIYRARRRPLPLAVAASFVLLAEALVAVALSRAWRVSGGSGTC